MKQHELKIASFNINGINGRLPVLLKWLKGSKPDIVCLQELKAVATKFPEAAIRKAGYEAIWQGQKSWNGVAILSRVGKPQPLRVTLPGNKNDQDCRYIEAICGQMVVACIYAPNGNPYPGNKFKSKIAWLRRLNTHAKKLLKEDVPVILAGDFNIIPTEIDVYKPSGWINNALFRKEVRKYFSLLLSQGWTDAIRNLYPEERIYTFWDYLYRAWEKNSGLRLDHFLLSPHLLPRLKHGGVDSKVRGWQKASDHAPVWISLTS